jgi:hypothetical protein
MDVHAQRFDTLKRSLTTTPRRGLLAGLTAGLLAPRSFASGINEAEAKKKGKGKKKRKNKKRKNTKAQARIDATCSGPSDGTSVRPPEAGPRIAQTFTALRSGDLISAEIEAEGPGLSGELVLRLAPLDSAGLPTNNVLSEAVVAVADLPKEPATIRFEFSNPFRVVAGTEYALVLTRFAGGGFAWNGQSGNPCSGRSLGSADQTAPFTETEGLDLIFTTFVRS